MIRSFGILDPDNGPNNLPEYGKKDMPYPGYFVVDNKGVVKEKFFGDKYYDRFTPNNVIGKLFPALMAVKSNTIEAPYLQLTTQQSDQEVVIGSRVTLAIEVTLPAGFHVYAPEVKNYQPIQLLIDSADVRLKTSQYPAAKIMELPAIKEKIPVYDNRFIISQDLLVMPNREFQQSLNALGEGREFSLPITIKGRLKYQACDDKTCFKTVELPISWNLRVHQMDKKRASESIQDHR
jgi:hypothetical protein